MFYPNKKEYHFGAVIIMCLLLAAFFTGMAVDHKITTRQYQDIMSGNLPVPSPIYAFKR